MAKRDTLDYLAVLAGETAEPLNSFTTGRLLDLPLAHISPSPWQARKHFDSSQLTELADTIREHGVLQPILVRTGSNGYELIAGERRWRAAQLAGVESIPALVRDVGDEQAATLGLVENLQRSDLNPIEEAEGYQALIDRGLSQQSIGSAVGKSVSAVSRSLGLLGLADPVKEAMRSGQLNYAQGRVLLPLSTPEQAQLARLAIQRSWNSRQIEQAARKLKQRLDPGTRRGRRLTPEDPDIAALSERISRHLGARVEFRNRSSGPGQFVIHYADAEECNGILAKLHLLDLSSD